MDNLAFGLIGALAGTLLYHEAMFDGVSARDFFNWRHYKRVQSADRFVKESLESMNDHG